MSAEIRVFDEVTALGAAVAERVVAHLDDAARRGARCVLGWPAGRTPQPVLAALAERARAGDLDLSRTVVAMMDEYVLPDGDGWVAPPPAAHFSCLGFARREIADRLNALLPAGRRLADDAIRAADPREPGRYETELAAAGGVGLFLVAIGASDGHVAFNPPGTAADSRTRIVPLAESTRRDNLATFPDFAGLDEVPTHGVSVGLATIAAARELAVVAHGAVKRAAVARTVSGDGFDAAWPASFVRAHPNHTYYLDRAAAGEADREDACAAS